MGKLPKKDEQESLQLKKKKGTSFRRGVVDNEDRRFIDQTLYKSL